MDRIMDRILKSVKVLAIAGMLVFVPQAALAERVEENRSMFRMLGDLLVARPLGLVVATDGTAAYIVSLPVSVLGGNAHEAAEKMVVEPVKEVLVRCLGCSRPDKKEKIK